MGAYDELRRTPLHAAVAEQRLELCEALLAARADVQKANGHGLTALELVKRRKVECNGGAQRGPQRVDPLRELLER